MKEKLIKFIVSIPFLYSIYNWVFERKKNTLRNEALELFRNQDKLSHSEITELNQKMLREVLMHAGKTVPYYKDLFKHNGVATGDLSDFKKIPMLTKDIVKSEGARLISSSFKKGSLLKRSTSGSTGQPMEFFVNSRAPEIDLAQHLYLYEQIGRTKNGKLVTIVASVVDEKLRNRGIFWTKNMKGPVFGDYILSSRYFTEESLSLCLRQLLKWNPEIIRGYPSALNTIAEYLLEYHSDSAESFNLKGIILTSEICTFQQKSNIEAAFGCEVYFEYGHKEISVFCSTSPGKSLYTSSAAYSYVEVLNEDGSDTAEGKIGKIVTSGFLNYGMPFIRYDTGDLGEVASRNGGVVSFSRIIGREQDYILDINENKVYVTGTIGQQPLEVFKHIVNWQFFQDKPGYVEVRIVKKSTFTQDLEIVLLDALTVFRDIEFSIVYVQTIEKTKTGKHLFVKREA